MCFMGSPFLRHIQSEGQHVLLLLELVLQPKASGRLQTGHQKAPSNSFAGHIKKDDRTTFGIAVLSSGSIHVDMNEVFQNVIHK